VRRRRPAPRFVILVAVVVLVMRLLAARGTHASRSPGAIADRDTRPQPTTQSSDPRPDSARPGATDPGCPLEGDAKNSRVQALNLLKNRTTVPGAAELDTSISVATLVAPGEDRTRFRTSTAVRVSGYVADVKVGGVETVNCKAKDPDARDTHIELTLEPMSEDERKHLIVEVTPRWRAIVAARGADWSTKALRRDLKGRWVEVTGWLLYDEEHQANAANTHRGNAKIWRATAWEVHPITSLRVLERPPAR
jgi:hypothetical protein